MTQYKETVERQRLRLAAETWSKGIKSLHAHSIDSMWYDDRPEDTKKASVIDTQFNDNSILRRLKDGTEVWMIERPSIDRQVELYLIDENDRSLRWE